MKNPYALLFAFALLLVASSCSLVSSKSFHSRKYTNTKVHYKRLAVTSGGVTETTSTTNHQINKVPVSLPKKEKRPLVYNSAQKQKTNEQIVKTGPIKKTLTKVTKAFQIKPLTNKTSRIKSPKEEATYHKSINIANMLLGTITAFFGVGIITFALGYISMNCYYQKDNLKLSRILYFTGLVIGLVSVMILLILIL